MWILHKQLCFSSSIEVVSQPLCIPMQAQIYREEEINISFWVRDTKTKPKYLLRNYTQMDLDVEFILVLEEK